jgi:hypothetical protein
MTISKKSQLIIIVMHGAGGAGGDHSYSPSYPWKPTDSLKKFMEQSLILDPRLNNSFTKGIFWKGALEAAQQLSLEKRYDSVSVICSRGYIFSRHGEQFTHRKVKKLINANPDTTIVPIGKSLGGFQAVKTVDNILKKYEKVKTPFALFIDPDNFFTPDKIPARILPNRIKKAVVIRQENSNYHNNFFPHGLRGREIVRKDRSQIGITDYLYPQNTTFPSDDPHFHNREVTHWTIDEHIVLYGHPKAGTVQQQLLSNL